MSAVSHKVLLIPITLHQLTSFLTVAREGSVSRAAERLYVTQPSISAAIAALSREVGAELTERSGRGIALTPAGETFRSYVEDVLGLLEQGTQAAREVAERSRRTLRLVAVATAAEYVVPPLLRTFGADHPEIDVSLEVANRALVFERVLSTGADIAVAGRPPADDRVIGEPFLPNELVVIAAADDSLAAAHARLERLDQAGGPARPRIVAPVARRGGGRARGREARPRGRQGRRTQAAVVRVAVGGDRAA